MIRQLLPNINEMLQCILSLQILDLNTAFECTYMLMCLFLFCVQVQDHPAHDNWQHRKRLRPKNTLEKRGFQSLLMAFFFSMSYFGDGFLTDKLAIANLLLEKTLFYGL
jgi:hypothetical protein